MKDIIFAILIAVISSFTTSVFDRIFREYNPDTKKLISKTRKFLHFIVKYILPISFLIFVFIDIEFNKTFVLVVSMLIALLACNILIDYMRLIEKDLVNYIYESNKDSMNMTKDLSGILINYSDKSAKAQVNAIENLVQSIKNDTEQKTNKNNL